MESDCVQPWFRVKHERSEFALWLVGIPRLHCCVCGAYPRYYKNIIWEIATGLTRYSIKIALQQSKQGYPGQSAISLNHFR